MELDIWYDLRNPPQWYRDPAELYAETLEQIAWADSLGFGAVWLSEHHFTDDGYLPAVMPMLGAVAGGDLPAVPRRARRRRPRGA